MYAAIAWRSFRRYSTYRAAMAAGCFTNTVFGVILTFCYLALWEARPGVGGYDTQQAVTYVWLGQALLATVIIFGGGADDDLAERVRTGDIAIDLYRPADLQGWWLAADLGRAAYMTLGRGLPPTVFAVLVFHIELPKDPLVWVAFTVSVLLAVVVSFAIRFMVALSGFWLLDSRGVQTLAGTLAMFMSGMLLPLTVFPPWLRDVAQVLPWSAMRQVPSDVYLGQHHGLGMLGALGFQAFWAAVLLGAGRVLMAFATRKVVVQGG